MEAETVPGFLALSQPAPKKNTRILNQMDPLITRLLNDKEYYVQKGLGWTLRELHNVYPEQAIAYLQTHINRSAPSPLPSPSKNWMPQQSMKSKMLRKG